MGRIEQIPALPSTPAPETIAQQGTDGETEIVVAPEKPDTRLIKTFSTYMSNCIVEADAIAEVLAGGGTISKEQFMNLHGLLQNGAALDLQQLAQFGVQAFAAPLPTPAPVVEEAPIAPEKAAESGPEGQGGTSSPDSGASGSQAASQAEKTVPTDRVGKGVGN